MRGAFVQAACKYINPTSSVFLTGDLGFNALEPLRDAMGSRFINAGVAEQNMISVAAGLAKSGLSVWAYSIAPFCYARPFEQIRNDLCLHALPVRLVGNGGGYGYGVMGATHHAIEDYGVLLTLPGMRAFVPAFACDLDAIIPLMQQELSRPSYLRLGKCELPVGLPLPAYRPWRRLLSGAGPLLVAVGALAGGILKVLSELDESIRPEFWVLTELPLNPEAIPNEFVGGLKRTATLWVIEEHVAQGSFGQMLATWTLHESLPIAEFRHFHAKGYPSHRIGSQAFHRQESGIDAKNVLDAVLPHQPSLQGK
jgi:transketolase